MYGTWTFFTIFSISSFSYFASYNPVQSAHVPLSMWPRCFTASPFSDNQLVFIHIPQQVDEHNLT